MQYLSDDKHVLLGGMMTGKQAHRIWLQRRYDHPLHPVTLYRAVTLFAGCGLMLR
ncbi:hypothetical protein [Sphingomonas crocodyli]|uniref:hypothetical protein n=1 Tax=Sphingomonas crocodyli TaxID=1979270 RepID=UPI001F0B92D3|nr:hypothetical protein [Sphingomonas crocodyli]